MRFRPMVGLVVLLVAAGCSEGSGSPTTPPTVTTTLPAPPTLPGAGDRPPALEIDAQDLDFEALRQLVGTWELVSFPRVPFSSPPRLNFGYLRTNERGDSFEFSVEGLCTWGSYVAAGNQLRVYSGGSSNLLWPPPCSDTSDDELIRSWLNQAETWFVQGDSLSIASVHGVTARFLRVSSWPESDAGVDDGLETVATRLHFVDDTGFLIQTQEQEAADGLHPPQNVNWIAWSPGSGQAVVDGFDWKTDSLVSPNSWDFYRNLRDSFVAVEYPDSFDETCLLADMNSLNGTNTASVRYRRTGAGAELLVDEEGSSSPETGHTDEILRAVAVDCSADSFPIGVTVGRADGVTDAWTRVDFGQLILDPVVVAGPASLNGSDPGVVEVRNVTSLSFEIRFHEWDYLDGRHPTGETVSYIVAERGVTTLPSGARIEAGTIAATPTMTEVVFDSAFPDTPVVISTVLR